MASAHSRQSTSAIQPSGEGNSDHSLHPFYLSFQPADGDRLETKPEVAYWIKRFIRDPSSDYDKVIGDRKQLVDKSWVYPAVVYASSSGDKERHILSLDDVLPADVVLRSLVREDRDASITSELILNKVPKIGDRYNDENECEIKADAARSPWGLTITHYSVFDRGADRETISEDKFEKAFSLDNVADTELQAWNVTRDQVKDLVGGYYYTETLNWSEMHGPATSRGLEGQPNTAL